MSEGQFLHSSNLISLSKNRSIFRRARRKTKFHSILGYDTLANFAVGKKIGKGQFSEVYKVRIQLGLEFCSKNQSPNPKQATSKCDGRTVALKKVQLFHMMDAKSRADCIREIDLLKKLRQGPICNFKKLGKFRSFLDPKKSR